MSPEQRRGASREVHKRKLMADDPQIRFNFSEPPEESKEEGEMSVESKLNAKGKKKRKRTAQPALEKESKVEGKLKKKRKTAKVKGTEAKISKKAKISKIEVPFRISIIQTRKPELIQGPSHPPPLLPPPLTRRSSPGLTSSFGRRGAQGRDLGDDRSQHPPQQDRWKGRHSCLPRAHQTLEDALRTGSRSV
jgi:hypothetical protein